MRAVRKPRLTPHAYPPTRCTVLLLLLERRRSVEMGFSSG